MEQPASDAGYYTLYNNNDNTDCHYNSHSDYSPYRYSHRPTATGRKEGNVLFNDTLNTFYLRLYGVMHMV